MNIFSSHFRVNRQIFDHRLLKTFEKVGENINRDNYKNGASIATLQAERKITVDKDGWGRSLIEGFGHS